MAEKMMKLKVAEAIQDDVNKGIVRIDSTFLNEIDVKPGDIVEMEGERKTVAIADRAYPGDIGLNIVRMDGIIRKNAKTGIGEMVQVRKAQIKEAKKVIIAPARKGIVIRASPEIFKQGLLGRAVVKGDIVSLGGSKRRRSSMMESPFFEDVFSILDESMMGFGFSDIKFVVVDVAPKQAVIIAEHTEVVFNPEAVEVKEELVPEVTYEDIGGLADEIKKVREMVELPLKHPEIFERLGIEAPKGVLLHGAPGTGKTLLAKAVANETNSHFILINGPEIMSKYYGQSLPGDEEVLVIEDGMMKRLPIQDIVDNNKKDLNIVCFDENGKIVFGEVTDLIKHKTIGKILAVQTRSGRNIRVTDYHSLFTLGNSGIESTKTSDLIANESYIAIPNTLPHPQKPIEKINLLVALKQEDYGLRIRNAHLYVQKAKEKIGIKKVAEILKVKEKYVYDIISKQVMLPVKSFLALLDKADLDYNKEEISIATKGKSLPVQMELTEDLCTFFGIWLAEGSYTAKNEVRISLHRDEEAPMLRLCNKLFGNVVIYRKPNASASDIIITFGALGKIMKNVLHFNSGSRTKRIPDFVFNLNKNCLAAFLRGYISGDGSLNMATPAPMVEVVSENPKLIDDFSYLMLRFGVVGKIYSRKDRPQKRYCFANTTDLDNFRDIGFLSTQKNQVIYQYLKKIGTARRDRIPITDAIRDVIDRTQELKSWQDSQTIGKEVFQKHAPGLVQLFKDIYWDKVMSIKEVDAPEYVYDLGVDPCHNFIAGFGGIFAHNSEENLRKKFEEAQKNAPAIIFIDEIDAIASKREETRGEVERRVVAQLLALMDGLQSRGKVVVIAATNVPNILDQALRRPGRFDREIEIGVPSKEGRLNILKIHTRYMPLAKNVSLKELAAVTHGFVGADLSSLAKESAMIVLRRILPELSLQEDQPIPKEILEQLRITQKDFKEALKVVRPSALREVLVEIPNIKWEDIGGLGDVKQELIEAVEWPLKYPEAFKRLGVSPPKGVLMYGAPGTGKTLLAKAVANESQANFISVKGPELLSKWVGESEKAVREIFKKARQVSPCVVFFDEVDSLVPRRGASSENNVSERVVNQLLTEIDGLEEMHDVVIIAATNRPDIIDPALLRPGRFDRLILTPAPDEKGRLEIFKVHTDGMPLKNVKLEEISKKTEGYVGADIEAVCREAAIFALRESMDAKEITMKHIEKALDKVSPSVDESVEKTYESLKDSLRASRAKQIQQERPIYMG